MTQHARSELIDAIDTTGNRGTTGEHVQNIADSALILDIATISDLTATLDSDHYIVLLDGSSNAVTVTLPALASANKQPYWLKALAVDNTVTVDGNSSEQIEGSDTYVFATAGDAILIVPGTSQWHILAEFLNA